MGIKIELTNEDWLIETKAHFLANYREILFRNSLLKTAIQNSEEENIKCLLNKFYIDWGVRRNVRGVEQKKILFEKVITQFTQEKFGNESIDKFVEDLHNIPRLKFNKLLSLTSKTAFILKPDEFFPYDRYAKNAIKNIYNLRDKSLKVKGSNSYSKYKNYIDYFETQNSDLIQQALAKVSDDAGKIEKETKGLFPSIWDNTDNFEVIRKNRIIDNLLWTKGKSLNEYDSEKYNCKPKK